LIIDETAELRRGDLEVYERRLVGNRGTCGTGRWNYKPFGHIEPFLEIRVERKIRVQPKGACTLMLRYQARKYGRPGSLMQIGFVVYRADRPVYSIPL
jgi:hypothetical protein